MATVLIVDDRPINREFLRSLLGYGGHRLIDASDGAEALQKVVFERPDLVVTDILMPRMDGFQFTQRLRSEPSLAHTKVIFYTATYSVPDARKLANACGVSIVLPKPSEPEVILRAVNESLGLKPEPAIPPTPVPSPDSEAAALERIRTQIWQRLENLNNARLGADVIPSSLRRGGTAPRQIREAMPQREENFSRLRNLTSRLCALVELRRRMIHQRDPAAMQELFCSVARKIIDAEHIVLAMLGRAGMKSPYCLSLGAGPVIKTSLAPGTCVALQKVGDRGPLRLTNTEAENLAAVLPERPPRIGSVLSIPLATTDQSYGVLCFLNPSGGKDFNAEDEEFAIMLAAELALLQENLDLYDLIQQHAANLQIELLERERAELSVTRLNRVYAVLSGINNLIVRVRDRKELFSEACRIAVDHGNFCIAWIGMLDVAAGSLTPVAWAGADADDYLTRVRSSLGDEIPAGNGILSRAIRSGKPEFDNDIEGSLDTGGVRRQEAVRRGYRSAIALPLKIGDSLIGILTLIAKERDFFNDGELALLAELATDISFAMKFIALQRDLSEEQQSLHNLMDNVPDAIYFKDTQHRFTRLNKAQAQRLKLANPEHGIGRSMRDFVPMDRARRIEQEDDEIFVTGNAIIDRVLAPSPGPNENKWTSTTKAPIRDQSGRVIGLVGISRDITERKLAEEKVRRLNRVYAVLSGINTLIVRERNRQNLFEEACRIAVEQGGFGVAWIGMFDAAKQDIVPVAWAGLNAESILRAGKSKTADDPYGKGVTGRAYKERTLVVVNELLTELDIGSPRRLEAVRLGYRSAIGLPLTAEGVATAVMTLYADEPGFFDDEEVRLLAELAGDVSFALDFIEKEEKVTYLAYYDALTGLPNRLLFRQNLEQSLHLRNGDTSMVAVVLFDIERFRQVNDTLGWASGDDLLRLAASRLRNINATAGRLGPNTFAVIIRGTHSVHDITQGIESKLQQCFDIPYLLAGRELRVGCRVGVSVFPGDGSDADTLMSNAEAALRRARSESERYTFYAPAMNAHVAEIFAIENRLHLAVQQRQFVLHYQPKVDLRDNRIVGAEALIRWNDPENGLVSPGRFIPVLEETGLIVEAGRWAVEQALSDIAQWRARGLRLSRVAVNVSPIQLRRKDFLDGIIDSIARSGDEPELLELELTESVLMQNMESSIRVLSVLRGMGIHVSIDDFGTGYSSLGYLTRLPVDNLKIDRSFVTGLTDSGGSTAIASGIIALAHSLKLRVIAEGVETREQAAVLTRLDCDEAQGYLFSKPLPAQEFETLLLSQPKPG